MICQRSGCGRFAHEGMPDSNFPLVMNQNNSPGFALLTEELSRAGAGPIPRRLAAMTLRAILRVQFLAGSGG